MVELYRYHCKGKTSKRASNSQKHRGEIRSSLSWRLGNKGHTIVRHNACLSQYYAGSGGLQVLYLWCNWYRYELKILSRCWQLLVCHNSWCGAIFNRSRARQAWRQELWSTKWQKNDYLVLKEHLNIGGRWLLFYFYIVAWLVKYRKTKYGSSF